jgi:hypothetical protein
LNGTRTHRANLRHMDLEERTIEDTLERGCAVCGAQLTNQEIFESRDNGGPFLCSVHAAEQLPAEKSERRDDDVA